ncbi:MULTISPECIES: gene transfer agent family protein [unclassified Bradyrhizobium]|uniref:gene transfer agent family protein n=1 Tax=unclassified Bradyrhizobium TaxID=2631580 RepID=UPI0029168E79|nr:MULTISPECIES: gene transfer agent family protein [unclassified Bradyrhizobium]
MTDTNPCARAVTWGETTYPLNLNHPWVRRVLSFRGLPGHNGNSPTACISRFENGTASIEDVERVLELGLIGAGMPEREAERLLDSHVRGLPLGDNAGHAMGLLVALYLGNPQ